MGRLRASIRYRGKAKAGSGVSAAAAPHLVIRRCGVAGCENTTDRAHYCLCDKHYKALPANLRLALTQSRNGTAFEKAKAFTDALDCLEAMQGQLSTLFLDDKTGGKAEDKSEELSHV